MTAATERDLRLVVAYLTAGSTKGAAQLLDMRPDTYRHRLGRVYRKHGVRNMSELVYHLRHELEAAGSATDDALAPEALVPMM